MADALTAPCTIYLIRHTQSAGSADPRSARITPEAPLGSSLTAVGREQARELAQRLAGVPLAAIVTSDLKRAAETAAILAEGHDLSVAATATLREMDGTPLTLLPEEKQRRYRAAFAARPAEEQFHRRMHPAVESYAEAAARMEQELCDIAGRHPGGAVAVVSHGGAMRALLVRLGYATLAELPGGALANCCTITLRYDGTTLHLIAVEPPARAAVGDRTP